MTIPDDGVIVTVPEKYAHAGEEAVIVPDSLVGNSFDGPSVELELVTRKRRGESRRLRVRMADLTTGQG